jgi:DNA ligase-1
MAARLAAYDAADVAAYRRILAGEDDGGQDATGAAGEAGDGPRRGRARRYPFFLAHPLNSPPAEALGEIGDWLVEWKWDGIRAQLLRRTDGVLLWSRGEEPVAGQFPQIAAAGMELEAGTVLDGEIVAWGDVGSGTEGVLPFARLQTHLNRTASNAAQGLLFATERAVFLAFDVLERGGEDLRGRPLRTRRAMLEEVIAAVRGESREVVRLSPAVRAGSWEELSRLREESRERNVEGFVLKHWDSTYGVGRTKPDAGKGGAKGGGVKAWWKWKVDPYSVDAVLLFAQPCSGRRAGLHTDYTFGLWETEGEAGAGKGELTPFAKAYSGLTNEEIERLDAWIRRHTVGRSGPIRSVAPEQVFEIGFEAIQPSKRHKSGIAVRFPRILRWRTDKRADEADTLETLRGLLRARGGEA